MDVQSSDSFYTMIPKRALSRFVLTYDVLPLELCFSVNRKKVFSHEVLQSLISQGYVTNKEVILELTSQIDQDFVSLSDVIALGFNDHDALDMFVERSYENYRLEQFGRYVIATKDSETNGELQVDAPENFDKLQFSSRMALTDGIINLANNKLRLDSHWLETLNNNDKTPDGLFQKLLSELVLDGKHTSLAYRFFELCTQFNIDSGWELEKVVKTFEEDTALAISDSSDFQLWVNTANKIINNEEVKLDFSDEKNVVLRAMTLVLLNPEMKSLEAIKAAQGERLGDQVYNLATTFVQARTGYSFLSAEERELPVEVKAQLQKLNASLHNPISDTEAAEDSSTDCAETVPAYEIALWDHSWVDIESETVGKLKGVKPMAGFDLSLIYDGASSFAWRIIDAQGPKGMEKLKGQLALNLLTIQDKLPSGVRFEINDSEGLLLQLPVAWSSKSDLIEDLSSILILLVDMKIAKKVSAITP